MNGWQSVFIQSPVNNGYYDGERLPQFIWGWPKDTWFQTRLDYVREHCSGPALKQIKKRFTGEGLRNSGRTS